MNPNPQSTQIEDTADCTGCWCELPESALCPECGLCLESCCQCQPAVEEAVEEDFEPRKWRFEVPYWGTRY